MRGPPHCGRGPRRGRAAVEGRARPGVPPGVRLPQGRERTRGDRAGAQRLTPGAAPGVQGPRHRANAPLSGGSRPARRPGPERGAGRHTPLRGAWPGRAARRAGGQSRPAASQRQPPGRRAGCPSPSGPCPAPGRAQGNRHPDANAVHDPCGSPARTPGGQATRYRIRPRPQPPLAGPRPVALRARPCAPWPGNRRPAAEPPTEASPPPPRGGATRAAGPDAIAARRARTGPDVGGPHPPARAGRAPTAEPPAHAEGAGILVDTRTFRVSWPHDAVAAPR